MSTAPVATHSTTGQLGTIVSWKVPPSIAFDALKAAMTTAGIDVTLAAELHPTHALSRALGEMKKARVIRKLPRRDARTLHFQFTKEFLDALEIRYERETELALDTETGVIACAVVEIRDTARQLLAEHQAKRLTSDLTRLLQRFYSTFAADLIPIREQGGAYFVPAMHKELVDKTRVFLENIGGHLRSFDVRLGSDDTSASVAESMTEYLHQLIGEFRESCDNVDGASRKDVKERRRETVGELRRKLELYRGLLSGYADHIDTEIKTAEEDLLRKLATGLPEGKAE